MFELPALDLQGCWGKHILFARRMAVGPFASKLLWGMGVQTQSQGHTRTHAVLTEGLDARQQNGIVFRSAQAQFRNLRRSALQGRMLVRRFYSCLLACVPACNGLLHKRLPGQPAGCLCRCFPAEASQDTSSERLPGCLPGRPRNPEVTAREKR